MDIQLTVTTGIAWSLGSVPPPQSQAGQYTAPSSQATFLQNYSHATPPVFTQISRGLTDWWVFAVMIFTASGSQITRSLSEPTAILPFRGYRLKIFAALVLVTATNWFSSIFPVACSHTRRTKYFCGERVGKSPGMHHLHSHRRCWLAGPKLLRLI